MSSQKYDGFCCLNNSTLKRLAEKQLGEEACVFKRRCMPKNQPLLFRTGSQITQASLDLALWPRITLNVWSSHPYLPRAGHVPPQFYAMLEIEPRASCLQANTLSTETQPQPIATSIEWFPVVQSPGNLPQLVLGSTGRYGGLCILSKKQKAGGGGTHL